MDAQHPVPPLWQGARLAIGLSRRAGREVAAAAGRAVPRPGADRNTELAVGVAAQAFEAAAGAIEIATGVAAAVGRGLRPLTWPLRVPLQRSAQALDRTRERGRAELALAEPEATRLLDALLPRLVEAVLDRLDLTELVRRHVDLDRLVAHVDLNAAAARLNVDAVAAGLDLDAAAARLDIDRIAARLDIDRVAARLDLEQILRRLDLNALIASVDVDAIASRIDLDAIVARLDLVDLAEDVIDRVDLAEIIRSSSGSVASEAVRDVRLQSIEADEAVSGFMDRLMGRQRHPGHHRGDVPAPRQPIEEPARQAIEAPAPESTEES